MAVEPDDWLLMEQMMENKNHSLLQAQVTEIDPKPPQLLLISSHAAKGTSSASTFSAILLIGGKKGVALVDNGSTDTFMDYTFASKLNCAIHSALPPKVAVARGGGGVPGHINNYCYYCIFHPKREFQQLIQAPSAQGL
jgi:hypothetical protein